MYYKFRKAKQTEQTPDPKSGVLKVEVPHWAVEVRVYNGKPELETGVGKIKSDDKSRSGYSLEAVLKSGSYLVQMSLQGKTESEWVRVNAGKVTEISPKAWDKLKFTSAAPLKDIDNYNRIHSEKAAELSRSTTWQHKNGGNSRLFLFARTLDPKSYGDTFSDGLQLLDATGEVITDFSDGFKKNKNQGWIAFNADLPAGGYILRRGRSGVRLRYQVFYLCDGWETQIFLKACSFPSLSTWSLNMARRGSGFHPYSEAILAAEAVKDNLRYSSNSLFLLQNEKIKQSIDLLLDEKMENPWLGILAAHAIMRLREQTENLRAQVKNLRSRKNLSDNEIQNARLPQRLEAEISQAEDYFTVLEQKVKPFLDREIGEHPDVRALLLADDFAADRPFDFPPSLLASLRQVQAHSLKFADTISLEGLTDCVVDSLADNSPWTAWRHLARQPRYGFFPQAKRLQIKQSGKSDFSVSAALSLTTAARTPVYRLAEDNALESNRQTATETVLRDAPMIQKSKEVVLDYAKNFLMSDLPEKINFNSADEINKVLAGVTPEEVSRSFGIPLSRTEKSLKFLHAQAVGGLEFDALNETPQAGEKSLGTVRHAILEYALSKFGKSEREVAGAEPRTQPKYTIREIVNRILSEADRLSIAAASSAARRISEITSDTAFGFAKRLYASGESLLKHADFVLITDSRGKILYSNGAFLLLVSPKSTERMNATEKDINEARLTKQKDWEKILETAQVGLSDVENNFEADGWQKWKLSRTEIVDGAENRSSISYLNLLRLIEYPPLDEASLREIDLATANLSFYAPLLIYASAENKEENEKNLRKTIDWIESQIK